MSRLLTVQSGAGALVLGCSNHLSKRNARLERMPEFLILLLLLYSVDRFIFQDTTVRVPGTKQQYQLPGSLLPPMFRGQTTCK